MNPVVPVSWGELLDKITILEIKAERLSGEGARANVLHELSVLSEAASAAVADRQIAALKAVLRQVNESLWSIEDQIRDYEARQVFDAEFVRLARAVYRNNDERGRLKRRINELLGSAIVEEKQYTNH